MANESAPALPAFLHPFAPPTRPSFIEIVRGSGALIWDASGREYVDAMASLWYCAAGHGRQEIADAVGAQLATLAAYSCFDPFTNGPADALAERLVELNPMPEARVFLCDSGSEAVDTAMKLARLTQRLAGHPGRTLIISRTRGYHGTNLGGTSAQGIELNRQGWGPLVPDVVHVPGDDSEALSRLMAERSGEVAAVIAEPVQGAGGVYPPTDGYLAELRRLCDHHGALLVFDEVITAFGRLGKWFGADHFGVRPDMITFAKAVTSGYVPLGGVIVGDTVRSALESEPGFILRHGYTYSGHPGACAAALANLDVLANEGLLARAPVIGARLGRGLHALAADGAVAAVRGEVAVWAVALHEGRAATEVRDRMLERGVITRAIGADTLTFCPPLVTTDEQVDRIIDVVADAVTP
ncbi:MAG: aspartate aminotransferase family protein [Ilumatobacteraceae bacterium]